MTTLQTQPQRTVSPFGLPRGSEGTEAARAECPTCGKLYCRVKVCKPRLLVLDRGYWRGVRPDERRPDAIAARERFLHCDHCPRVVAAFFRLDSNRPLERSILHYIDSRTIDRLLALHPDLAGVDDL